MPDFSSLGEKMVEKLAPHCDVIFLDFHAETTSEKVSMAWHLDGKVAAVVGTHTHIPTNDARIFPQGTAFLSRFTVRVYSLSAKAVQVRVKRLLSLLREVTD